MNQIRETEQQNSGAIDNPSVATREPDTHGLDRFRASPLNPNVTKNTALAIAAIAILALPVGFAISSKKDFLAQIPFVKQIETSTATNEGAVLAVDATGLTIRGKNISAATVQRFENATVAQLANLHRIYAGWAQKNQDLTGSLLVKLQVHPSGKVVTALPLVLHLSNSDFTGIVMREVRNWTFPTAGAEPVEITIPLLFVPKGIDRGTVVQWERKIRVPEEGGKTAAAMPATRNLSVTPGSANASKFAPSPAVTHRQEIKRLPFANPKNQMNPKQVLVVFKTTQAIALRTKPRFSSKSVHAVDAETELNVLENKGDWLKVKVADAGSIGFLRKEFITEIH